MGHRIAVSRPAAKDAKAQISLILLPHLHLPLGNCGKKYCLICGLVFEIINAQENGAYIDTHGIISAPPYRSGCHSYSGFIIQDIELLYSRPLRKEGLSADNRLDFILNFYLLALTFTVGLCNRIRSCLCL